MKINLLLLLASMLIVSSTFARDDIGDYSVKETLALEQSKSKLGDEVSFYFGNQKHPGVQKNFGEVATNKKTNAFGKSDKEACQWVFLSAMISLKERALREGGNAVINIKSNYRNDLTTSNDTFKCGAGAIMAGVALVGEVVLISK